MNKEELAYVAGFFDGEGSVTIHDNCRPSPRGISPNHTLQVSIGNTDPLVLRWIHAEFGGSLLNRKNTKPRHRAVAQWIIRARLALSFLEAIQPFVRMKRQQVMIAIAYQRTKSMRGPKRVTPDDIRWREEQRRTIRALNAVEHIAA